MSKNDTILLQYILLQFQYFITTSLCTLGSYKQMFHPNSFNGNDLVALFSLIRTLNLFGSEATLSKWLKCIEKLHSSRWSDTAHFLTFLRHFPVSKNVAVCFTIISNVAFTICVSVNNVRTESFLFSLYYKDFLKNKIRSDIVYRYTCSNCKAIYFCKTC